MRKTISALVIVAAVAASGCASLSGKRAAPDEFAVARNAPLIIPPDFSLSPPVAGTAGLSPTDAQQQAIDTLFGSPAPRSAAETSLLDDAGRSGAQAGIRSTVWDPDTRIVDKGPTTLQILLAPPANSTVATAQAGQ
ncbi:DUF3035 domain-containing protein [Sphingomonas sp. URHD0057]|uniref:DUF3035 domain-containing protein n=1 Tax=Sphingomonas sp. URHD0057 TaxID=1380389 RepID=UPI00048EECE3|nr:DUF3035 domain-containing protein [Sphingomonas sp. URHD0057]